MNGKLTAEQVRDAVMSADRWEKPMGNTGLMNTHLIIRDDGWQAIADELNATLGDGGYRQAAEYWQRIYEETFAERTCRDASVDSSVQFYCSECECTVDVPILWGAVNYCPNCGARVVE